MTAYITISETTKLITLNGVMSVFYDTLKIKNMGKDWLNIAYYCDRDYKGSIDITMNEATIEIVDKHAKQHIITKEDLKKESPFQDITFLNFE